MCTCGQLMLLLRRSGGEREGEEEEASSARAMFYTTCDEHIQGMFTPPSPPPTRRPRPWPPCASYLRQLLRAPGLHAPSQLLDICEALGWPAVYGSGIRVTVVTGWPAGTDSISGRGGGRGGLAEGNFLVP